MAQVGRSPAIRGRMAHARPARSDRIAALCAPTLAHKPAMLDRCGPCAAEYPDFPMSEQTPAETELAHLLVDSLNLEGVEPGGIDPEARLFGEGLGLDSIDALELALAISKKYGFQL